MPEAEFCVHCGDEARVRGSQEVGNYARNNEVLYPSSVHEESYASGFSTP